MVGVGNGRGSAGLARFLCAVLFGLCAVSVATAQWIDPHRPWRTAQTAHFTIHFDGDARETAQRVGQIAERSFVLMQRQLGWTPKDRVDIVLYSGVDFANGFASPLPFNRTGIFLAAPIEGSLLDRSDWLELVILHEMVHVFHLDKAHGLPHALRSVFGRQVWTFPNLLQPHWLVEGLAVVAESRARSGAGRLYGSYFEAQMRDERQRGFMRLSELNADGRSLPLNRNYLYGAYFFDYLARTYGADAAARHVAWYSQQLLPFRVQNSTLTVTQKKMDGVWEDFLADLAHQVDQRSAQRWSTAQKIGQARSEPLWAVESMAMAANGDVYVVAQDGIAPPTLQRYGADGSAPQALVALHPQARIDVRDDGAVLIAQPEVCGGYEVLMDLYQWTPADGLRRLTHCERFVQAVWLGQAGKILALQNDRLGRTRLVRLDAQRQDVQVLLDADAQRQWIRVAASPDGESALLIRKEAGLFALLALNLTTNKLTQLHEDEARITHAHMAANGDVRFVSDRDGAANVWRYGKRAGQAAQLVRLTHAHTAVLHFGGAAADGRMALGVLQGGKIQLYTMAQAEQTVLEQALAQRYGGNAPAAPVLLEPLAPKLVASSELSQEDDYSAWPSLRPRAWWPVLFADRGTFNVGAAVFGSDALQLHQYLATPYVEVTQGELLGSAQYGWRRRHFLAAKRELSVRRSIVRDGDEDPLEYERVTQAQWISLARFVRLEREAAVGLGVSTARRDGVIVDGAATREEDKRLMAVVAEYDSRRHEMLSEGPSRGQRAQVCYESYEPFKDSTRSPYTGHVVRWVWDGYYAVGRSVLAAHWTEGRGQAGRTEPFTLGGEASHFPTLAPELDERDVSLRGYVRGGRDMIGAHVRKLSLEWRTPIADIDRHAMVPPIGVNRVSATVFFEAGGVWDHGGGPDRWLHAVGVEALTEVKLGYLLALQMRIGVARGLDDPGQTRGYITLGRAF